MPATDSFMVGAIRESLLRDVSNVIQISSCSKSLGFNPSLSKLPAVL